MDITSWSKPWNDEPPVWIFVSMYPAGTYKQLGVVLRNVLGSSQANPVWDIRIESNLKHRVDVAIEVSWTTVSISMTALIHIVYAIVTWVRDMSVLDVQGVLPRHLAPFVFTGRKPILLHRCIPIWWCRSRCAKCLDMSLRFHLGIGMVIGHYKTDGVLLVEAPKHVGPMQGFGFRAKYSTDTTLPMPRPCSFWYDARIATVW
jgi:hypothetical protein